MSLANNRRLKHLCIAVASVLYCAGAWAASELDDSAQAKAKLAAVRARIADLANRLGDELEKRDAPAAGCFACRGGRRGAAPLGAAHGAGARPKCAAGGAHRLDGASAGGLYDRAAGRAQAALEPEQSGQPRPHARVLWIFRPGTQR